MSGSVAPVSGTGIEALDRVLPQFEPGRLWLIIGPRGIGVTELALCIARQAGTTTGSARVLINNSHLTARPTSARLGPTAAADVTAIDGLPLPVAGGSPSWATSDGVSAADLVVYDTIDEVEGVGWPAARAEALAVMRELRRVARLQRTCVLGTFRVAPLDFHSAGVTRAWRVHSWHEAAMDAADVILTLCATDTEPYVRIEVDSRHSPSTFVEIRRDHGTGRFPENRTSRTRTGSRMMMQL